MTSKLEEVFGGKKETESEDVLYKAMSQLLIMLLQRLNNSEENELISDLTERTKVKYPKYSSLANTLIPKPM